MLCMFMDIYTQSKSLKTFKEMLPNKFRTVVTLKEGHKGWKRDGGRINKCIHNTWLQTPKNDLKQIEG